MQTKSMTWWPVVWPVVRAVVLVAVTVTGGAAGGGAYADDDAWQPFNPFAEFDKKRAAMADATAQQPASQDRPLLRPMAAPGMSEGDRAGSAVPNTGSPVPGPSRSETAVMQDAIPPPVERGELTPVMSTDGSGLPFELWSGLDIAAVETLISTLEIPPRSPALHNLWTRLITSDATPPTGSAASTAFAALRLEALYRSGLASLAAAEIAKQPAATDALLASLAARNAFAAGSSANGCAIAQRAATLKGAMPKRIKSQAILISGYCAALANDTASAGLAAELAREEGEAASPGLEALDALSIGAKAQFSVLKQISLLDYRLAERAGGLAEKNVLEKAEPALLVALANDPSTAPALRLGAAEAAARLNALAPGGLADVYRALAGAETTDTLLAGVAAHGASRRAGLFKAADAEKTPIKKTRLIRVFLDDSKQADLLFQGLQMVAPIAAALNPQPEIGWFAETAAEIGLASGQYDLTRRWVAVASPSSAAAAPERGASSLAHWLALADIADPNFQPRGESLTALESLAATGRFTPDALHRLATVLDALAYNVPIPLWDAASRTPQPASGYLPETGVLSQLQDAAKKKEFGRTVLLAMKALGPNGAQGAHMIALGDSIRALKRAGLEADARRLGLEALLATWPRTATN